MDISEQRGVLQLRGTPRQHVRGGHQRYYRAPHVHAPPCGLDIFRLGYAQVRGGRVRGYACVKSSSGCVCGVCICRAACRVAVGLGEKQRAGERKG